VTADFVAAMEEVLDLYATPYDRLHPKVNFDEMSKQLIEETRLALPPKSGQLERSITSTKRKRHAAISLSSANRKRATDT